jgi:lysozyme family protein
MINDFLIEELRDEYDRLVQRMKFRHPSYFDKFKKGDVGNLS